MGVSPSVLKQPLHFANRYDVVPLCLFCSQFFPIDDEDMPERPWFSKTPEPGEAERGEYRPSDICLERIRAPNNQKQDTGPVQGFDMMFVLRKEKRREEQDRKIVESVKTQVNAQVARLREKLDMLEMCQETCTLPRIKNGGRIRHQDAFVPAG